MVYATVNDFLEFAGIDESSAPENAETLIRWANDIIMSAVKMNFNPSKEAHVLAVRNAICAQVSYWIETGTNPANDSEATSYSLGELSVSLGKSSPSGESQKCGMICTFALTYLRNEYLLYRGLRHGHT